jgi:hypothetical protein
LNLEQSSLLKSLIDADSNNDDLSCDAVDCKSNTDTIPSLLNLPCAESYIDSIMEELNIGDDDNLKS